MTTKATTVPTTGNVVIPDKLAKLWARKIIDTARKNGLAHAQALAQTHLPNPFFRARVAKLIEVYRRYNKGSFKA